MKRIYLFLTCFIVSNAGLAIAAESQPIWQIFKDGTANSVKWTRHQPNPRFMIYDVGTDDPTDDLVWDRETNLVWQRSPSFTALDFYQASSFCYVHKRGGRYGWRAFTIEEGATLIDDTQPDNLPPGHPFLNVQEDFFWSSSGAPTSTADDGARNIDFHFGVPVSRPKTAVGRAWCVRGGSGHDTRF